LMFSVFPGFGRTVEGFRRLAPDGIFERYAAAVDPVALDPEVHQVAEANRVGPVRLGPEVAMAPDESAFNAAARWSIRIPDVKSTAVDEVFLHITYAGDVARIYCGGRLITDDFYHGAPWEIGLRNIPAADLRQGLELKILPLRKDAPIYLAAGAWPAFSETGQVARLIRVQVIPQYRAQAQPDR